MNDHFDNLNILITGGSRGIGAEAARFFAGKGATVFIAARTESRLNEVASGFQDNIIPLRADLNNPDDIQHLKNSIREKSGKLDVLINNAGVLINKPFLETTDAEWETQISCNLTAPARLIRELVPLMNKGGHIMNIGSMGGFQGSSKFPGLSAYSAAKGGLAILSECLAGELSSHEISVNCLCLGAVQTEMLEQAFPGFQAPVSAKDMGSLIAWFSVTGKKFFNGKVIPVALADPS